MFGWFILFCAFIVSGALGPSAKATLPQPQRKTLPAPIYLDRPSLQPIHATTWMFSPRRGSRIQVSRSDFFPLKQKVIVGLEALKQWIEGHPGKGSGPLARAWELEKRAISPSIDPALYESIQSRHVLFAAGFLNELSRLQFEYFSIPIQTLERNFCTTAQFYGPNSRRSTTDNVSALYDAVKKAHQETGKPVVLIGHSKGGCEALFLSLRHPELLLEGVLDRTVILQAPIQGVPFIKSRAHHPLLKLASCVFGEGLACLEPEAAQARLEESFQLMQAKLKEVSSSGPPGIEDTLYLWMSERIFFVRSATEPENRNQVLQFFLNVIQFEPSQEGPNDGVLALSAQSTPLIGTDLGWVDADHLHLISGHFDKEEASEVAAFHRALWRTLFSKPRDLNPSLDTSAKDWLHTLSLILEPTVYP